METKLIKTLCELAQTDIDAFHAYSQAIAEINIPDARDSLKSFQQDHSRHIAELSEAVSTLGGTPPTFRKDFKGFLIEGMTAVARVGGNRGAIMAMRANEEITNKAYDAALQEKLDGSVRQLVERNRNDERRHRTQIQKWIDEKVWDLTPGQSEMRAH